MSAMPVVGAGFRGYLPGRLYVSPTTSKGREEGRSATSETPAPAHGKKRGEEKYKKKKASIAEFVATNGYILGSALNALAV